MNTYVAAIAVDTNKGMVMELLDTHYEIEAEAVAFASGYMVGARYPVEARFRVMYIRGAKNSVAAMRMARAELDLTYGAGLDERESSARLMNLNDYLVDLGAGVVPDELNDDDRRDDSALQGGQGYFDE